MKHVNDNRKCSWGRTGTVPGEFLHGVRSQLSSMDLAVRIKENPDMEGDNDEKNECA